MKALILSCIVVVLAGIGWLLYSGRYVLNPELAMRINQSTTNVAYVLSQTRWTEFHLPPETISVRTVTNANLPENINTEPTNKWRYVLEYQLINKDGRVVQKKEYHTGAVLDKYKDPKFSSPVTASFYFDPSLIPSNGMVTKVNLKGMQDISSFRVRVKRKDPTIKSIIFRASVQENVPPRKLAYLWRRMSPALKTVKAEGNLYPHEMLREGEIRNLLIKQNIPLGPSGILGRDYVRRTLYVSTDRSSDKVTPPVLPPGIFVDEHIHGVIPLPEGKQAIRLIFTGTGFHTKPPLGSKMTILWFGRTATERLTYDLTWQGTETRWERTLQGGLLEIISTYPSLVRAYRLGEEALEITPDPFYVRTYAIGKAQPIRYKVNHLTGHPTPFRVDLRLLLPLQYEKEKALVTLPPSPFGRGLGGGVQTLKVHYTLLNKHGDILKNGLLLIDAAGQASSNYERISAELFRQKVSNPSSFFFSLPEKVTEIAFSSDHPVLLAAYNYPPDLIRETKVPEDFYLEEANQVQQPAWYALKPMEFEKLVLGHRFVLLMGQHKPPEVDPLLLSGHYVWEDYHPRGSWLGKTVLTPLGDFGMLREEALPNIYQSFSPNQAVSVHFQSIGGRSVVEPNIAFTRPSEKPTPIQVSVDKKIYYEGLIAGTTGEIRLPTISTGKHTLEIKGSAQATFYANYVRSAQNRMLKRLLNRMDAEGLIFDYEKIEKKDETLSFRFYVPAGRTTRSMLSIRVESSLNRGIEPYQSWSFLNRKFNIRPNARETVFALGSSGEQLDGGEFFSMSLGEDIPPGKYQVHVDLVQGEFGYLSLSRLTPGHFEQRRTFIEPGVFHE